MAEPPQKISRKPFKKSSKNSVENKSTRFFFWRTRSGICEKVASESVCHYLLLWSFLCMSPKFHLKIFHILNIPYIRNILCQTFLQKCKLYLFFYRVHPHSSSLRKQLDFFFSWILIFSFFFKRFLKPSHAIPQGFP